MRVHQKAKHHLGLAIENAEEVLRTTVPGQLAELSYKALAKAAAHFIIGASLVFLEDPENRQAEARLAAQRKRRLGY